MKRFFLIPLLTLMCSVMAWAEGHSTQQTGDVVSANYQYYRLDAEYNWIEHESTLYYSTLSDAVSSTLASVQEEVGAEMMMYSAPVVFTLLSDVNENVTLSMTYNSYNYPTHFDLAGHTLTSNVTVNGFSTSDSNTKIYFFNGTLNGSINVATNKAYLYLGKDADNGLTCNLSITNGYPFITSNSVVEGQLAFYGENTTGIQIETGATLRGIAANNNPGVNFATANSTKNISLAIYGTLTGAIQYAEGNNIKLYMTKANGKYYPSSSSTGMPAAFNVTAGKFNFDPTTPVNYLQDGYYATESENIWTVAQYIAKNVTSSANYTTTNFMDVYNAATAGDSIVLYKAMAVDDSDPAAPIAFDKFVKVGYAGFGAITVNAANVTFDNENQAIWAPVNIATTCSAEFIDGTYNISGTGNITINGATCKSSKSLNIASGKTFTMQAGKFTSSQTLIFNAGATCNILGGEINASYDAISLQGTSESPATLNMSAGSITSSSNAIALNSGKYALLNITGGSLTTTNSWNPALKIEGTCVSGSVISNITIAAVSKAVRVCGSGITATLTNISATSSAGDEYDPTLDLGGSNANITINGGSFTSQTGPAVKVWNNNGIAVRLNGGTYKSESSSLQVVVDGVYNSNHSNHAITLGNYNDVAPLFYTPIEGGPAFGYTMTQQGSTYWWSTTGAASPIFSASIDGATATKYSTIAEFLNIFTLAELATAETLELNLIQDMIVTVTSALEIPSNLTCTVNLNDKKLTVDGSTSKMYVAGNLIINAGTEGQVVVNKGVGFHVAEGGALTVNGGTFDNQGPDETFNNDGTLNLNDADVISRYQAIYNTGIANLVNTTVKAEYYYAVCSRGTAEKQAKMYIKGLSTDSIRSNSSTKHGLYSYALKALDNSYCEITKGGTNNDEDINISGVQGGFAVSGLNSVADIRGGKFDTRACAYGGPNHYALYVAYNAAANVYDGKYSTANDKKAIFCGNEDVTSILGVANIYGGVMSNKAYVQHAPTNTFPSSVPETSQWYSSFGADAPLPAGYEYEAISSGDDYNDGYRWRVICTNEDVKEVKVADATIPWQQNSTWVSNEVPEETTIVTIPVDATVIVKADLSGDAVAEQVFVNQGAKLTVESGKTLSIGDGGMNIANGGSITVEPGAVVKIGTAGVITTEKDALVLVSNDDQQAALLYDPTVPQNENTQPKATVKLETKSKQIGDQSYVYERFAIPTLNGAETIYKIEGGIPKTAGKPNENVALYNDAPSFLQAVWAWDNNAGDWQQLNSMLQMEPFKGYQLTNNSANGGLVYVFEGNLVGNNNGTYKFVEDGFHFFGNSYSAEINIKKFLDNLESGAEKSVWLYDPYDKTFKVVTPLTSNGRVTYGDANETPMTDIRSMQAFIMMLNNETNATVDYASAIWGNPKYNPSASLSPARERETVAEDWATIKVASANGQKDEFTLVQSEEFSSAFENGADASKFMNKENINLYATTNAGNLAMMATDNIDRTVLAFAAGEATEYTISFEGVEGNEFTLRDIVTGAVVSMTEGATYTFTQEANTTNAARFEILGSAKLPTAIENVEAEAKAHGIYTIAGQFVGNDFNALSAGVYVVNGIKIVK